MRVGASKSDADSSWSSHPAIKSVLIRKLLVIYIYIYMYVCVLFFLKLLDIFYPCLYNHQRKSAGGSPKDDVLSRTLPANGAGWDLRSAR